MMLPGPTDPSAPPRLNAQRVRDNVAFVRRLGDVVPGLLWSATPDGAFDYVSQLWLDYTGSDLAAALGSGWLSFIHPDDVERASLAWSAARATGGPLTMEIRLRAWDTFYRWFLVGARPFRNGAGKITSWLGLKIDIDDQKRAEAELRRLNEGLEQRVEQRTRERDRVWRLAKDMLVVASSAGYFLSSNPSFTEVMGWTEQEMRLFPFADLAHPDQRDELADKLARLKAGEPVVRHEIRTRHKDRSYRWLSWTITADADMLTMVGRDVTAEREQAEALRQAEAALRQSQKMEAVGHLTGGLAHDFNNLLAGISGSIEMLRARVLQERTDDMERFLDAAAASAARAASLTHRLLAFSRRQTLEPRAIDPNRLVQSIEDLIRRSVGPAVEVETVLAAAWRTLCDPNQLENALLNLAINARDAMPEGGRLTIGTGNARLDHQFAAAEPDFAPGDYVEISVADTGTGMAPEVVARAFDPFFTTKPLGAGTGLGLSMIYGFVRQSEGHVRIASELGRGSTVHLYLPRHRIAPNWAAEAAIAADQARETAEPQAGETVLVVDDEPVVRMLVTEVVGDLGYAAIEAADGPQAVGLLNTAARIDLMITDIGLPGGMNGRQVADVARRVRPGLGVLFITGYAEAAVIGSDQLEPGMQIMTKPFSLNALKTRIRGMTAVSPRL